MERECEGKVWESECEGKVSVRGDCEGRVCCENECVGKVSVREKCVVRMSVRGKYVSVRGEWVRVYLEEWDECVIKFLHTVCMHVYDISRMCFSAITVHCRLRQCPNGASEEF